MQHKADRELRIVRKQETCAEVRDSLFNRIHTPFSLRTPGSAVWGKDSTRERKQGLGALELMPQCVCVDDNVRQFQNLTFTSKPPVKRYIIYIILYIKSIKSAKSTFLSLQRLNPLLPIGKTKRLTAALCHFNISALTWQNTFNKSAE